MSQAEPALFPSSAGRHVVAEPEVRRQELHVHVLVLPLGSGRALRLAAMNGELLLSAGFMDDGDVRWLASALAVPLGRWPDVRAALDELAAGGAG
jgi:hypothetical protein